MGFAVRTQQAASAYQVCCTSVALLAQLQERAVSQLWGRYMGSNRRASKNLSLSSRLPRWTPFQERMRALFWTLRSTTTGPLVSLLVEACSLKAGLCALGSLLPAAVGVDPRRVLCSRGLARATGRPDLAENSERQRGNTRQQRSAVMDQPSCIRIQSWRFWSTT